MKVIVYKVVSGELNLFKLRNGKVVHIQKEFLGQLKESPIPDIPCYIQIKDKTGGTKGKLILARISDVQESSIKGAASFFEDSEECFHVEEL